MIAQLVGHVGPVELRQAVGRGDGEALRAENPG
jgi:hypothetical protein